MLVKVRSPLFLKEMIDIGLKGHLSQKGSCWNSAVVTLSGIIAVPAGQELYIIQVIGPAVDAAGDKQVLPAIVVQVAEEGRPAPVGGVDPGQSGYFAELCLAQVELKGVVHILVGIAVLQLHSEKFQFIFAPRLLQDLLIVGQHIQHHDVGQAIVVEIGHIIPHGGPAGMGNHFCEPAP